MEQGTVDLIAIWSTVEVQQQFGWATRANDHLYTAILDQLLECGHQCHVKVKTLWAQWV